MNRVQRIFDEAADAEGFARGYLDYVREVLAALDPAQIAAFTRALLDARERDGRIFIIGNGGSAATASHMANDIAVGSRSWERPFRAISLTDNFAVISALANDYDYDEIFVKQLQMQMAPGDVVVAISVSGNSPNIVTGIEWANENGAVSVGLTGFDGGRLSEIAQIVVHAPTAAGEYGPAEDAHMVIDHLVSAYLIEVCARTAVTEGEMSRPLEGRRALVTGATRGIGAAIAERLLEGGADVTATGTTPDGTTPDGTPPDGCEYRQVDLSERAQAEAFAAEIAGWELDVLVNNAGLNRIAPFAEIDPSDFDLIQEVNVRAPLLLCRAVVPGMSARGWGRIVNVSSVFGMISKEQRASYSASKFALDGLTSALAAEVAADGVLANCVAPGFVETDLTREILGEQGMAELAARVPIRRFARPEEIAALVAWLAGEENTYVSGQNLVIDGGFTRV